VGDVGLLEVVVVDDGLALQDVAVIEAMLRSAESGMSVAPEDITNRGDDA